MPEQRAHRRPGEEIRVHDLVRIAAQQELPGLLQAGQNQRQLHIGQVLHFVDHHKVVQRLRQGAPFVSHQIQVELTALCEPTPVTREDGMRGLARRARQQRLPRAQRQVVGQRKRPMHMGADDAAKLFEQGVGIQCPECVAHTVAMALEPGPKRRKADFAPVRHAQRLDELPVTQEVGFLCCVLITMGIVHGARRLGQIGRLRHVEYPARGLAHPGQRDSRLAGAGRADHDHRGWRTPHCLLVVVKDQRFVEQVERVSGRMQPAHGHRLQCRVGHCGVGQYRFGHDLGIIDDSAAQKT